MNPFTKTFFKFLGGFAAILLLSFFVIAALSWWSDPQARINYLKDRAAAYLAELF